MSPSFNADQARQPDELGTEPTVEESVAGEPPFARTGPMTSTRTQTGNTTREFPLEREIARRQQMRLLELARRQKMKEEFEAMRARERANRIAGEEADRAAGLPSIDDEAADLVRRLEIADDSPRMNAMRTRRTTR